MRWHLSLGILFAMSGCTMGTIGGEAGGPGPDALSPDAAQPEDSVDDVSQEPLSGSAGCQGGLGIPEGINTFSLDGLDRRYVMRLPAGYSAERSWPLVLALHPNGGSIASFDAESGAYNIRGEVANDAILIIPEAIDNQWRDYGASPDTWPARIEQELAYIDRLLADAKSNLCIRTDAVFTMGFSGGGSFSAVLGCRRSDFRAIAAGGSVIYFDPADCVATPAAWITMGVQELATRGTAVRDHFLAGSTCTAESTPTEPTPCVRHSGCDSDSPVDYCEHPDGHIWPEFGSAAVWQFFQRQLSE